MTRRRGRMGGAPCIGGTRITTATIFALYRDNYDKGAILTLYPHLDPRDIDAAVAYEHGRIYERRRLLRKGLTP